MGDAECIKGMFHGKYSRKNNNIFKLLRVEILCKILLKVPVRKVWKPDKQKGLYVVRNIQIIWELVQFSLICRLVYNFSSGGSQNKMSRTQLPSPVLFILMAGFLRTWEWIPLRFKDKIFTCFTYVLFAPLNQIWPCFVVFKVKYLHGWKHHQLQTRLQWSITSILTVGEILLRVAGVKPTENQPQTLQFDF